MDHFAVAEKRIAQTTQIQIGIEIEIGFDPDSDFDPDDMEPLRHKIDFLLYQRL